VEGLSVTAIRQAIAVPLFVDEKPLLRVEVADRTPGDQRRVGVGLLDPKPLPHGGGIGFGRGTVKRRFHNDTQDAVPASRRLCEPCLSMVFMAYLDLL
jgi:hypothetical protein